MLLEDDRLVINEDIYITEEGELQLLEEPVDLYHHRQFGAKHGADVGEKIVNMEYGLN